MFDKLPPAPPDPILGLTEAFLRDSSPDKINLGAGVYVDETGQTPLMDSVKRAESRILERAGGKVYLPIEGLQAFRESVLDLVLGPRDASALAGRAEAVQSIGGTGGVRISADFIRRHNPPARAWVTDPTWPNHPKVFEAAGFEVCRLPWLASGGGGMNVAGVLAALEQASSGDVLVLHGSCHNPTGVDPDPEEWRKLAEAARNKRLLPVVDLAYLGVGEGLREDSVGLRTLCETVEEVLVAVSFSKNFSLYRERVGALLIVGADAGSARKALGQMKSTIRASYSSPPAHGALIVAEILADPTLRRQWESEVERIRLRVRETRKLLSDGLASRGIRRDLSFIGRQRGMFAYFGLDDGQVERLRKDHSVYVVAGGRVNVAGITPDNVDRLTGSLAEILA